MEQTVFRVATKEEVVRKVKETYAKRAKGDEPSLYHLIGAIQLAHAQGLPIDAFNQRLLDQLQSMEERGQLTMRRLTRVIEMHYEAREAADRVYTRGSNMLATV